MVHVKINLGLGWHRKRRHALKSVNVELLSLYEKGGGECGGMGWDGEIDKVCVDGGWININDCVGLHS
jgi:hypothetical protein